jgi:ABC-type sugar transport system ATPase subunit
VPEVFARLDSISKRFDVVNALSDVSIAFRLGEVHALLGENGAGKSTLVRILAGVVQPDSGTLSIDGRPVTLDPLTAIRKGIATIYQDRMLVPQLTIAENVLLGREPTRGGQWVRSHEQMRKAREALLTIGLSANPRTPVHQLSIAEQQLVVIARALTQSARLLILDEPTPALTNHETDRLFQCIDDLRKRDIAILYITHRLHEVVRIADTVSVLKDGRLQRTLPVGNATEDAVIRLMIGRALGALFPEFAPPSTRTVMEVEHLTAHDGAFVDVSFTLKQGEIVGIAGLEGSGKSSLAAALVGATRLRSGTINLDGKPFRPRKVRHAVNAGIAYVPPDRRRQGLMPNFSVVANITISVLRHFSMAGMVRSARERLAARKLATQLHISGEVEDHIRTLSGGNQQKAMFARALCTGASVMVLDEPVAGVDIGAKADIYRALRDLCEAGKSMVVVSSDMTELLGLCHRILVLRQGRVSAEFPAASVTEEDLLRAQLPVAS